MKNQPDSALYKQPLLSCCCQSQQTQDFISPLTNDTKHERSRYFCDFRSEFVLLFNNWLCHTMWFIVKAESFVISKFIFVTWEYLHSLVCRVCVCFRSLGTTRGVSLYFICCTMTQLYWRFNSHNSDTWLSGNQIVIQVWFIFHTFI